MEKTWYDELERRGLPLTKEQRARIEQKINQVLTYEPRIGVFGKTGVGKSSLCNALFGQDVCPVSDVEACTRNTQEVLLNMGTKGIKLIDVPGAGESMDRDEEYAALYAKLLPELDLVLWLIKADDRALSSDENFFQNVVKPHIEQNKPFFFVLNQADKIEPFREWNAEKHEPGVRQFKNIHAKIDDIAKRFQVPSSKIIAVSADEKYNLVQLVDEIVYALPKEKNISVFKAVDKEFHSAAASAHVKRGFLEVVGDVISDVIGAVADKAETIFDTVVDVAQNLPIIGSVIRWWPF